jgi:hypothetical protein
MNVPRSIGFLLLALAYALPLSAAQPGEWRTYRNERFGYDLQYPAGWNVVEARQRTDDTSPGDGNVLVPGLFQQVAFQEPAGKMWPGEFMVLVHEHVEGQTLDEWADTSFTGIDDESLVSDAEDTVLGDRTARLFSVFGFDHTDIVVAFVHDGKIYEISYTGTNPNDPDVAEHGAIYQSIKQSFKLVPSINPATSSAGARGH